MNNLIKKWKKNDNEKISKKMEKINFGKRKKNKKN